MGWTVTACADEASDRVDDQIRALNEAQIDHIDLRSVDGTNIVELPVDEAEQVRKKLDAGGIGVCMFGSPIGKIDLADDFEIDLKRLRHLGELRKVFDAEKVRIFSYYNKKAGLDDAGWQAQSVDRLLRLSDEAAKLGLVLYHENELGIYGGPLEQVCVLRDKVASERPEQFKLIFDFDNFNQNHEDVWADYLELRDSIAALHVKESKRQPDGECQHVPAGEGDGHMPEIFADLAKRGWEGPLTLEPHLARSAAVVATGAHGQANAALADLTPYECFQVAAKALRGLLADVDRV